jgi:lipopolysaccharide export LptBFGC system permease protein LptF
MVTAFIGVGVYTFYPPGADQAVDEIRELRRDQDDIRDSRSNDALAQEDRDHLSELEDEIRAHQDVQREHHSSWAGVTSIILIVLATLVMGISLFRADQLPVISNGLLLGGVFTMLYGTGWVIASGDSRMRFWVMTLALVITLVLGWVRFVRERGVRESESVGGADGGSDVAELVRRVEMLEQRAEAAARALGGEES